MKNLSKIMFACFLLSLIIILQPVESSANTEDYWQKCSDDYQYETLNEAKKKIYKEVEALLKNTYLGNNEINESTNLIGSVPYKNMTQNEAIDVYEAVVYEHPLSFFLSSSVSCGDGYINIYSAEEFDTLTEIENGRKLVEEEIQNIIKSCSEVHSDYNKILSVHDIIADNASYAYRADGITPQDNVYAHNIIGYAKNHSVVCEGYAKTFMAVLNYMGIDTKISTGWAGNSYEVHAWNVVKLNGSYYAVDITWDDTIYGISYDYFLKGDSIYETHYLTYFESNSYSYVNAVPDLSKEDYVFETYQFKTNGVTYEALSPETAMVLDASNVQGKYTIPVTVTNGTNTYTVTEIGSTAFANNTKVTQIVMPDTIVKIRDWYVHDWEYTSAFDACTSLKKIELSNNLSYIGMGAFEGCISLSDVSLPEKLKVIKDEAFFGCTSLKEIIIPSSVTVIGQCAFSKSGLISFTVPKTCTEFHDLALSDIETLEEVTVEEGHSKYRSLNGVLYTSDLSWIVCYPNGKKDEEYTLPGKVTKLDSSLFSENKYIKKLVLNRAINSNGLSTALLSRSCVEEISVPEGNPYFKSVDGVLFSKDGKTLFIYPPGKKDKEYFIPAGTESIGIDKTHTFETCKYLEELYVPASVKEWIGIAWQSSALKQVVLASKSQVKSIPAGCFQDCNNLERICFPASIKAFISGYGNYGSNFLDCYNLKVIYVEPGAGIYKSSNFGNQTLSSCVNLKVYGEGTNNALEKLAKSFGMEYVDTSSEFYEVLGITFSDTVKYLRMGGCYRLGTVVYPTSLKDAELSFTSSDNSVAVVDKDGLLIAVGEGSCIITVEAENGVYSRCKLIVQDQNGNDIHKEHDQIEVDGIPATCTQEGKTARVACSVCDEIFVSDQETIPALGHEYKEEKIKEATCDEKGIIQYTCTHCGDTYTKDIPATGRKEVENKEVTQDNHAYSTVTKDTIILSDTSYRYTGKVQKPDIIVKDSAGNVVAANDYSVIYSNKSSKKVGTYSVKIVLKGNYSGTITKEYRINKASQTLKVSTGLKKYYKLSDVVKKSHTFTIRVAKNHGKVMYKSNNKKIYVNSKGKVTVKKGIKKGTYKILLTVKGNSNYQSGRKTVKIVIE